MAFAVYSSNRPGFGPVFLLPGRAIFRDKSQLKSRILRNLVRGISFAELQKNKPMKQTVYLFFFFTCICCRVVAQPDGNDIILQNTLQNYVNAENTSLYKGSSLPVFSHKEDTKGNRYLFDSWVKGTIVTANNYVIDKKEYFFNFDKITNDIFMTLDQKVVVEINKVEFKSFTASQ